MTFGAEDPVVSEWQPRGEALRKAVRFVSQKRADDPAGSASDWVAEATVRFDLNPAQGEWLHRFANDSGETNENGDG